MKNGEVENLGRKNEINFFFEKLVTSEVASMSDTCHS